MIWHFRKLFGIKYATFGCAHQKLVGNSIDDGRGFYNK